MTSSTLDSNLNPYNGITTPFLITLYCYPVEFPILKPCEKSKIGAPKSTLPDAIAWVCN